LPVFVITEYEKFLEAEFDKNEKFKKKNHNYHRNYSGQNQLSYETLDAAIAGDSQSIYEIVKHYNSYMASVMRKEDKYTPARGYFDGEEIKDGIGVATVELTQALQDFRKKY